VIDVEHEEHPILSKIFEYTEETLSPEEEEARRQYLIEKTMTLEEYIEVLVEERTRR
jgi:hypothetical protein